MGKPWTPWSVHYTPCLAPLYTLNSARDVHIVMSTALPFVNCISLIVKTCIRRNFKSCPITMNKMVLTSSAMWLVDVIKDVMSLTVPERKKKKKMKGKKKDPKAGQSPQS